MSSELEFDEKKFWIALFSAVIRREEKSRQANSWCDEDILEGREVVVGRAGVTVIGDQ